METYGIDISTCQSSIDWNKIKKNAAISFIIVRAAQGTKQDSRFSEHIEQIQDAKIPFGLYFASSAKCSGDVAAEAELALSYAKKYQPQYGCWYDMELSCQKQLGKTTVTALLSQWLEHVKAGGTRCGIYTNKNWLDTIIDWDCLSKFDLWYAAYPSTCTKTITEAPIDNRSKLSYPQSVIWQWSSSGEVEGIKGKVDLNVCYEEFKSLEKGYITFEEAKKIIIEGLGYKGIIL